MTVEQYQRVYKISQTTPDNIEQVAWMICEVFGKTYDQVENLTTDQFIQEHNKLNKQLEIKEPKNNPVKLQTDAFNITFGQFIECNYWLKGGLENNIHLVAASLIDLKGEHQDKAKTVLGYSINTIYNQVNAFTDSLNNLIASYPGLFPPPPKPRPGEELPKEEKPHPFLEQYGWIFSATQVADHEKIKLDDAYELPIMQALNDLAYLKGKQEYDRYLSKQ